MAEEVMAREGAAAVHMIGPPSDMMVTLLLDRPYGRKELVQYMGT